jgi:hypothetical protein
MFNLVKQVVNYQDSLYIIKRMLKESSIKEEFVQEYKEFLVADIVLKKDGMYYFANKIDEVEAIPEEEQTEQEA